jgi:hypothetical protein
VRPQHRLPNFGRGTHRNRSFPRPVFVIHLITFVTGVRRFPKLRRPRICQTRVAAA